MIQPLRRLQAKPLVLTPALPLRRPPPQRPDPAQRSRPLDPMLDRIEPCLPRRAAYPPHGADWAFEVHRTGTRLMLHVCGSHIRLLGANGEDRTARFSAVAAVAARLDLSTAILDGVAVAPAYDIRPDFAALQSGPPATEPVLHVFDILYLDGCDLRGLAQAERRQVLECLLASFRSPLLRLSREIPADGADILRQASLFGIEKVVARRRDRPYRPGRNSDWLAIDCVTDESFAVVGYTPPPHGGSARLALAARREGRFVPAGTIAVALAPGMATALEERLRAGPNGPDGMVPVHPVLDAVVRRRSWLGHDTLGHARFMGLRAQPVDAGPILPPTSQAEER